VRPEAWTARIILPVSPPLLRELVVDVGREAAFRWLIEDAKVYLAAYAGDVPSQVPVRVHALRIHPGAAGGGPVMETITLPVDEDDPDGPQEDVEVEVPTRGLEATGVFDLRLIPEWALGYALAREILDREGSRQ
jgi:hypothetical protein